VQTLTLPELKIDSEAYDLAMIARIQPFLGLDNQAAFSEALPGDEHRWSWREYLYSYFVYRDRQFMAHALRCYGPIEHWLIDVEAARQWNEDKHLGGLLEALSFPEAVALLYGAAKISRLKPTSVHWDHSSRTLTVRADDKRFATIRPLAATPVSDVDFARGRSTLSGLAKDGSFEEDLRRRLAKWPGAQWAKTVRMEIHPLSRLVAHFPFRQDWVQAAKFLITKAGVVHPTHANAQALVCAVFDAPDWDRLCGAMGRNKESGVRPVVVCTLKEDGIRQSYSLHPDFGSAVAMWIDSANALTSESNRYFVRFDSDGDGHSLFLAHGHPGDFPNFQETYEHSYRQVHLQEIGLAIPRPKALAHVLKSGFYPSSAHVGSQLRELFLNFPPVRPRGPYALPHSRAVPTGSSLH